MNIMKVSKSEILNILNKVVSSTFVHLVTETKVRMNKKGNPFHDKVVKLSSCNYLMGNDYGDRTDVNNKKEGIDPTLFHVQENKVGVHISKVVLYNEKLNTYYLQVERFDEIRPKVEYRMDGNPIEKSLFESYMIQYSNYEGQLSERKVKFISFKIDSIKEITLDGTKYEIES